MTITEFLHYLDAQDVDIWIEDGRLFIGMNMNIGIPDMDQKKKEIILRLLNNQFAKEQGWLVGNFGDVYCYQFSSGGFIFIERNFNETVDIYRCKFNLDNQVYQMKGLHEGVTFSEAFIKAKAFLDWFYSKNPH